MVTLLIFAHPSHTLHIQIVEIEIAVDVVAIAVVVAAVAVVDKCWPQTHLQFGGIT